MTEPNPDYRFFSCNVRGLNNPTKQEVVRQIIQLHKPVVACLQETKLDDISTSLITRILGVDYNHGFCYLPADGTRSGILLACRDSAYQFSNTILKDYTITTMITNRRTNTRWTLRGIYGP
jgi:exonuclease III